MPEHIIPHRDANDPAPADRFDHVSMTFHWATLLLIAAVFATAWARQSASDGDSAEALLTLHRSIGGALWIGTLARLIWKQSKGHSPHLPHTLSRIQRFMARSTQYALYILLLLQPATGFAQSIARGKPFELLGGMIPAMMARDKLLVHLAHDVHETTAWVLLGLIGLHALAALAHHFILRDGVLRSMLPPSAYHGLRKIFRGRE